MTTKTRLGITAALAVLIATGAVAETVLEVDLGTTNQITITATDGLSAATVSGNDTFGFYLDGVFGATAGVVNDTLVSGDLTSAQNTSDLTPDLFTSLNFPGDGLNVFSYTDDAPSDFISGSTAFSGTATWTIDSTAYGNLFSGAASGSVFFEADDESDNPGASLIGEWARADSTIGAVPLPAGVLFFGTALAGLGLMRRRRQRS